MKVGLESVAVIAVVFAAAACAGSPPGTSPGARGSASSVLGAATTAATTASPTAAATASPMATPVSGVSRLTSDPETELPPGRYRAERPAVEFTIPKTSGGQRWFGVQGANDWGVRRATGPCDGCEQGSVIVIDTGLDMEGALSEWLEHPNVKAGPRRPVEVGGATGMVFEASIPSEVIVFGGHNPRGPRIHVYIFDVQGEAVSVTIEAPNSEEFLAEGDRLVKTFTFLPAP